MKRKPDSEAADSVRKVRSAPRVIDRDVLPTLLGYNIRRAQIVLWRDFARTVAEGEIRPGMFSALALTRANPGIAQVELAAELGIDKASMVTLMDRLEDAGWILRTRSSEDRRRQSITLTAEGERTYKSLKREMLDHERKFAELFSDRERDQLVRLLQRFQRVQV
ncbi:MAG: MarR family winged helix-turn-helix transcriptional regulator [Povalibacter sp.]